MAVRTKPLRILEADHAAVRMMSAIEGTTPASLLHRAFVEYVANHRDEFLSAFGHAQTLVAAGNLEGLAEALSKPDPVGRSEFEREIASLR